jgi:PAS domain S-box-containing protein
MSESVVSLVPAAAGESVDPRCLLGAPPSVLEALPVATYACDTAGRILWFNRKAVEVWGRAPRVGADGERFCGSHGWLINGRRIGREQTPMAFVLKTGTAVHGVEGTVERADGSQVSVTMHIDPVKNREDAVVGAVNCFYAAAQSRRADESARRPAALDAGDQVLREQNQRLATTYEHATVGIAEIDATGRRLRVNETACAITGRSRSELTGGNIFNVLHPEDRDDDFKQYRRVVAGEIDRYSTEKRIVRKDGRVIWISVLCSGVRDGAGRFVYGVRVFEDITERKEAGEQLREREREFRELLEGLPAAVYTTDALGRVTFYNQAVVELSGARPELGSDRWPAAWPLYRPDGTPLPHDQSPMAVALKENRPVRGAEVVAERPDGTRVPFIPYPTPLHDAAGALIGAVNVLVDISERKQAETAQKVLLDELNHRVKNNMQVLHSLLRAAQRETGNAEAQVVLADAGRRVAAMAAAQQVLYAADNPTNYNTEDFVAAVCGSARQSFDKPVDIVCETCRTELPNDTAMPLALILNELLTNAAKHGTAGRSGASIKVGLSKHPDAFELSVEDAGGGFDLEDVRRRSSGLGLVTGLARQLGGTFSVERAPGARCVVRFLGMRAHDQ